MMYSNILNDKAITIFEKVLERKRKLIQDISKNNNNFVAAFNSYIKRKKVLSSDKLKQLLRNKVSRLSLKNILITNELKEQLVRNGIKMRCFILHGSTARGKANVSVKTGEIKHFKEGQYEFSEFFVTPQEASDIGIIIIVNSIKQAQKIVSIATVLCSKYNCQFTINLISSKVIAQEITANAFASPAIKRIFGLRTPICFYGHSKFYEFQRLAVKNLSNWDIMTDMDFKLLKQLGSIMYKSGVRRLALNKNYLSALFPALFLSRAGSFNLDFPKKRLKLVIPIRKQLTHTVKIA